MSMSSTTNTTNKKVAVAQLCSTASKLDNLLNVAKCARLARKKDCVMLFLPECFGFLGESAEQTLQQAEPVIRDDDDDDDFDTIENDPFVTDILKRIIVSDSNDDEKTLLEPSLLDNRPTSSISLLDGLRTVARTSGMWISAGGMHVRGAPPASDGSPSRVYNTHVILDNQGSVKAIYRKVHLFDVSIPGKVNLCESRTTAPGSEIVLCDSPVGKLGLMVCYDVRFPEQFVKLVEMGAEVLLVPSAFTVPTGQAHWHILLRARAIECQSYVIAAAQFGQHNAKRTSYGHSLVVDPWGLVVADAGGVDSSEVVEPPSIITCEIDLDRIASVRERIPVQQHRRDAGELN